MAKVQKIKTEVKSAIQRKSAYSLPNNPTDSGYKADDIRKAFYKPIIDITNSALTEIDRVVDELNGVLGYSQKQMDSVESVSGIYFHGADGIIYTFSDNEFTVSGYEGDKTDLTIPQTVLYQGVYYPVVAIGSSAFGGALKSVEIPSSVANVYSDAFKNCSSLASVKFLGKTNVSESNAFTSGKINFSVPKEYLTVYQTSLASYKKSLTGFDTIINNANDIVILYRDKLTKVTSTSSYDRVYSIGKTGASGTKDISPTPLEGKLPVYLANGVVKVGTPSANEDATPKQYVENRLKQMGALLGFSIDPSTYVMTLTLKNESGTVLSTGTVDLPLESMILGASYADGVLTLNIKTSDGSMNNNPIQVNISDLISGLVSDETFNEEVDRLDDRVDETNQDITLLENEIAQKEIYAHAAFHAEEAESARNYTAGGGIDGKLKSLEKGSGAKIALSLDSDYKMTIKLLNKKGVVLSEGMVDLPIESLITKATYSNGKLTLTFQSGDKTDIDISSLISGLVPETRSVNGKALTSDIELTAADVGAYGKAETWNKTEVSNLIANAKQELSVEIDDKQAVGYAVTSEEAEKAKGFIKGGEIDRKFKKIIERLTALENK